MIRAFPRIFPRLVVAVSLLLGLAVVVRIVSAGETPSPSPEILVKFVPGTSSGDRSKLEAENGLTLLHHFESIDVFHYRSTASDIGGLIAKLESNPIVVYAEMDQKHRALPSEDKVKAAER
jgi:hypothetical protein